MQHGIKSALCSEYLSNPAVWSKLHLWPVRPSQLKVSQNNLSKNLALLLLWEVLTVHIVEGEWAFTKRAQKGNLDLKQTQMKDYNGSLRPFWIFVFQHPDPKLNHNTGYIINKTEIYIYIHTVTIFPCGLKHTVHKSALKSLLYTILGLNNYFVITLLLFSRWRLNVFKWHKNKITGTVNNLHLYKSLLSVATIYL